MISDEIFVSVMAATEFTSSDGLTQARWRGGRGMPYKCIGNKLMHKKGGVWSVKQTCKSSDNCKAAMRYLYSIDKSGPPKGGKK